MTDETQNDCPYCDGPGSRKTFRNQVRMPCRGRVVSIDYCIHPIVAALNAGNIRTVASCCGHGAQDGSIALEDGRELVISEHDTRSYALLNRQVFESADEHPVEVHVERHFESVYEFYLEQPWLAEHTPSSFAEEHALVKLLGYCGFFKEHSLRIAGSCLVPA